MVKEQVSRNLWRNLVMKMDETLTKDVITALFNAGVQPQDISVTLASITNNCNSEEEIIKSINSFGRIIGYYAK